MQRFVSNKLAIILFLLTAPPTYAQRSVPVNVLVPTFNSPKGKSDIGVKTASILGLQIWRTYSRRTKERPFDDANIIENSRFTPGTSTEVEALAKKQRHKPHLVLWGKASEYGSGIVVESNLLIRTNTGKQSVGTNIWSVEIVTGKTTHSVSVDIPATQYEFAPIVLDPALVSKIYNRTLWGDGMNVYQLKSTTGPVIASMRNSTVEAISHDGDWSRVRVEDLSQFGWVYLPNLSRNPSEVINFCSGIIRIFREDWLGAIALFQQVLNTTAAPTSIKIDSYLYMALAYQKMNEIDKSYSTVMEAYRLNPYSKITTKYLCMSYLARLKELVRSGADRTEIQASIKAIDDVISRNKILFSVDDLWVVRLEDALQKLKSSTVRNTNSRDHPLPPPVRNTT